MASVALRRLSKVFDGGTQALHALDLDVRDGELLVLLGPSGSGKTTVLRCIAGLEEPTAGDIVIGERVVTHDAPAERDVAIVFQSPALYLHLTLGATMIYVTHDQTEAMTMGQRVAVLHEGRLRQVGTPEEVYQRPADVHVARLVGTPGMNVLQGRGRGTGDGGRVIEAGSLVIPIELSTYEGELQVGIRPEFVGLCAVDKGVGNVDVLVVEPLGSETLVHLNTGGQPLVARLPGFADVRVGTRVGVRVDRRRLYLFDAAGAPLA